VSLVIRLRQNRDRDTMISSCSVIGERRHDEEEQRKRHQRNFLSENSPTRDLTDYRGCSIDEDIFPNFAATFNSMTGVKKLSTTFPMFKFSGRSKMTFRCSVLVCRKNCPLARCETEKNSEIPQQEFLNVKILEKFLVETSVEVVDKGDPNYDYYSDENSRRNYFEGASRSEVDTTRSGSSSHHQTSALQLEEGEKRTENKKSNQIEIPPETRDDNSSVSVESEDQLCLSPSRLVLGFGILLVILLLALVASCIDVDESKKLLKKTEADSLS